MAKESSTRIDQNPLSPTAAPLFAMSREALAEFDRQTERWFDYGAAQMTEGLKVGRALYAQMMSATRAFQVAAEETAHRTAASFESASNPFTGSQP